MSKTATAAAPAPDPEALITQHVAPNRRELARKVVAEGADLQLGGYIPPEVCERILGSTREYSKYGQMMYTLLVPVVEALVSALVGRVACVRQDKWGLRIMTPIEAESYGEQRFQSHKSAMNRIHVKIGAAVKSSDFDDENQKKLFEQRAFQRARMLHHMNEAELRNVGPEGEEEL